MNQHENKILEQLKPHDRREVIGLAKVMVAVRSGASPKLLMAYKNVANYMNAHGFSFEDMGRRNPTKSWKIVSEVMHTCDVGFYQLEHHLALMGMV